MSIDSSLSDPEIAFDSSTFVNQQLEMSLRNSYIGIIYDLGPRSWIEKQIE